MSKEKESLSADDKFKLIALLRKGARKGLIKPDRAVWVMAVLEGGLVEKPNGDVGYDGDGGVLLF